MENLPPELIRMARSAQSPEELLAMVKENGIDFTEENAKAYFSQLHPTTGELSDDALDNVAGGTGPVDDYHTCPNFVCCFCGERKTNPLETSHLCSANGDMPIDSVCSLCALAVWQQGVRWVCSL